MSQSDDVSAGTGKQGIWIRRIYIFVVALTTALLFKVVPDLMAHGIVKLPIFLKSVFLLLFLLGNLLDTYKSEHIRKIVLITAAVIGIASIITDVIINNNYIDNFFLNLLVASSLIIMIQHNVLRNYQESHDASGER